MRDTAGERSAAGTRKSSGKSKRWTHPRHVIVRNLFYPFFWLYARIVYGMRVRKFREPGKPKRQFLILFNHQTSFDQFFVGLAFKGAVYYVASEDIFSNGFLSSLLRYYVAPIPINKTAADMRAIINCMKVAREGGTIALAPEGNRTYSGRTCYIKPSVVSLVRKIGFPVAFFRIEGGYGVQPRWSNVNRRGRMTAGVSRVLEPEEYAGMSDDELYRLICGELYVDEARADGRFVHKKSAEYLERVIYVCPNCGLSDFESRGEYIGCRRCGLTAFYSPTKELVWQDGSNRFRFVADWYEWQERYINSLDPDSLGPDPIWSDTAGFYGIAIAKSRKLIDRNAKLTLYADRIEVDTKDGKLTFAFSDIGSIAALGRNKMNIRMGGKVWQVKGSVRFNPLRYMNFCYRYKNKHESTGKDNNGNGNKFLGL